MKRLQLTVVALAVAFVAVFACTGCSGGTASTEPSAKSAASVPVDKQVRVMLLDCPGSMGLCSFVQKVEDGAYKRNYRVATANNTETIVEAFETGDVDIALTYPGLAERIYSETEGSISVVAISSLNDSAIMTANKYVKKIGDIKGRKLYTTSPNVPRTYVLQHLLEAAEVADEVEVEFLASDTEVVATMSKERSAVGVIGEPARSSAMVYDRKIHDVVSLLDLWHEYVEDGSLPVNSVIVVRKEFYEKHPDAVKEFLDEAATSVDEVMLDPYTFAPKATELGLSETDEFAEASILRSELTCITGAEMKDAFTAYLEFLKLYEPNLFGGGETPEDFFLVVEGVGSTAEDDAGATDGSQEDEAEAKERRKEAAKADALAEIAEDEEAEEEK